MKGIDTNVLVRYLTQDEVAQARRATALIERAAADRDLCFINNVVLCQLVWVLREAYGFDKATVVSVLEKILAVSQFAVEAKDLVRQAVDDYRRGRGDFSDYLIGRRNHDAGCDRTITFDRRLRDSILFSVTG